LKSTADRQGKRNRTPNPQFSLAANLTKNMDFRLSIPVARTAKADSKQVSSNQFWRMMKTGL
jgi:hypothetical protein